MRTILLSVCIIFYINCHHRAICGSKDIFKLTNVHCTSLDKTFSDFGRCDLKVIKRGVIGFNIHVKLFQLPINNVSLNMSFWKRANGYRPFLYNITMDFCNAMSNRKRYPLFDILLNLALKDSNINHTCPYDHDIIGRNIVVDTTMLKNIPLPSGDYMCELRVGAYNRLRAIVKIYFMRDEGF